MWLKMAKYIESKKDESVFLYFKLPVSLRKDFDHIDDLKKLSWISDRIYIDFNHGQEEHSFALKR